MIKLLARLCFYGLYPMAMTNVVYDYADSAIVAKLSEQTNYVLKWVMNEFIRQMNLSNLTSGKKRWF